MGKINHFFIMIGVVFCISFCFTGCNKTHYTVIIEAPTSVYEDYPDGGPPTAKVITILNKGEEAEYIHTRHSKDCGYLKIRLKDGKTGYIGWDGDYKLVQK